MTFASSGGLWASGNAREKGSSNGGGRVRSRRATNATTLRALSRYRCRCKRGRLQDGA